jgi:hypothetical protein
VAGVRRRLRDVGTKISGVLAGPRDEGADGAGPGPTATSPDAPAPSATTSEHVLEDPPVTPVDASPTDAPPVDPVLAQAVELARAAAVEVAGAAVGDHVGVEPEPGGPGDLVATHSFATTEPAYVGWRWAVTVARAEGADDVTVDEVVLLPGRGALLAPAWVPWSERISPGDLAPGDLLPPKEDDPRLVPSYADVDAEELPHELHRELGLGRPRVLSADGRADAALRWEEGEGGPDTPMARSAPGRCGDCGFLVPLAGVLGRRFGACANAFSPDDGRVVSLLHGCGAHSETVVELTHMSRTAMAVGEDELELVSTRSDDDSADPADAEAHTPVHTPAHTPVES